MVVGGAPAVVLGEYHCEVRNEGYPSCGGKQNALVVEGEIKNSRCLRKIENIRCH